MLYPVNEAGFSSEFGRKNGADFAPFAFHR
jgi:hypothetical protein